MNLPVSKVNAVRAAAVVGTVIVLGLAASLLWAAALGTISLGIIGGMGLVMVGVARSLPLIGQKFENRLLAARKAEARENPVEQKQNEAIRRQQILDIRAEALKEAQTDIRNMASGLDKSERENPGQDFSAERTDLQRAATLLTSKIEKYKAAVEAQEEFVRHNRALAAKYEFGQNMARTNSKLGMTDKEFATNQFLADEADKAMLSSYNRAFADMDFEFQLDASSVPAPALTNNPSAVLEIIDVDVKSLSTVNRS